jgi:hypothetical protein
MIFPISIFGGKEKMMYFVANSEKVEGKIGTSSDPEQRFSQLQIGNSAKLDLMGIMNGDKKTETDIRNKFKKYHIRGEWYKLNDEIIKFIQDNTYGECAKKCRNG